MRTLKLIVICIIVVSCGCKKNNSQTGTIEKTATSKVFLQTLLPESTYTTVKNATSVKVFTIEQKLIEGTTDEYSNKSTFIRDLESNEISKFISTVLEDDSYKWELYKENPDVFEPSKQFVVKSDTDQANVLFDEGRSLISVIDLDGQHILPISQEVKDFLIKLK